MQRSHLPEQTSGFRRRVARLAVAVIAFHALIPAGFMPAALDAGGPVIVCHSGAAGAFFQHLAGLQSGAGAHHHGVAPTDAMASAGAMHDAHAGPGAAAVAADFAVTGTAADTDADASADSAASHQGWESCPTGSAFASAGLTHDFSLVFLALEHGFQPVEPQTRDHFTLFAPYRARAPPLIRSRSS